MQKITTLLYLFCTVLLTASCRDSRQAADKDTPDPAALNDKAMRIITQARDSSAVYEGLFYLDQAIAMDSTYMAPYINKMNTLLRLNMSDKALETLQKLNERKAIPENVMFEGFIYDRELGDTARAREQYLEAIRLYDEQFGQTGDSVLLLHKGLAILFTEGREAGISYYRQYGSTLAYHPLYGELKRQAEYFNKEQFLRELW